MSKVKCAILYVTPSEADYTLFERIISKDDRIHVSRALSAEDALEKIRDDHKKPQPNLLITAWRLPNMPAIEFVRAMKADPALRMIPFVVFTTGLPPKELRDAYDAGVSAVITKPIDLDGTIATLSALKTLWVNYAQLPDCTDALRREDSMVRMRHSALLHD